MKAGLRNRLFRLFSLSAMLLLCGGLCALGAATGAVLTMTASAGSIAVAAGDFNGESKAGLATASVGSNAVSILLGNQDGLSSSRSRTDSPDLFFVAAEEFSSDDFIGPLAAGNGFDSITDSPAQEIETATASGIPPSGAGTRQPATRTEASDSGETLTAALASSPHGVVQPPKFSFGATTPAEINEDAAVAATLTGFTTAPKYCDIAGRPRHALPGESREGALLICMVFICISGRRRRLLRSTLGSMLLLVVLTSGSLACGGFDGTNCGPNVSGANGMTESANSGTITSTGAVYLTTR